MTDVAVIEHDNRPAVFLKPLIQPKELIEYHKTMVDFIRDGLEEGVDFGTIPGTKTPTLYKPGAERLCKAFGLVPKFQPIQSSIEPDKNVTWSKQKKIWNNKFQGDKSYRLETETGESIGYFSHIVKCTLELPDGRTVGEGLGSCSTTETKYVDRPRDCENTVLKMAKKRAFVDAVLTALGLSNRFTQDMEENYERESKTQATENRAGEPQESAHSGTTATSQKEVYTGTTPQQERVIKTLKNKKVSEEHHLTIHEKLLNRPIMELGKGVKEVTAQ